MIEFKFTNGNQQVVAFLQGRPAKIVTAVQNRLWTEMRRLANYIATDKLSGQVLNVRTGSLRRGVLSTPTVLADSAGLTGIVGIPKEVWYGKVHEFGAQIPEVDGPLMVFKSPQMNLKFSPSTKSQNLIFTRRHRAFTLPERSFMRTALSELATSIQLNLNDAMERAAQTP